MATINERIYRRAVTHQFAVQGFAAQLVRDIIGLLNSADEELERLLGKYVKSRDNGRAYVTHLREFLNEVRIVNAAAMSLISKSLPPRLARYGVVEERIQREHIVERPFRDLGISQWKFRLRKVSPEYIAGIVQSKPWDGRLLKDHIANISQRRRAKLIQAVNVGIATGQTADQITRRILGASIGKRTPEGRLIRKGGVLDLARNEVDSLVKTYIAHVNGDINNKLLDDNADLISKVMWISTLDERTTPICRPRDHKLYTVPDRQPIGHSYEWLNGPGQAHWRCRSRGIAVISSDGLNINWSKVTEGRRAATSRNEAGVIIVGDVPASTDYTDWLRLQPIASQELVLGRSRAQWFRDHPAADVGEAWNQKFGPPRVLTLQQLENQAMNSPA